MLPSYDTFFSLVWLRVDRCVIYSPLARFARLILHLPSGVFRVFFPQLGHIANRLGITGSNYNFIF